MCLSDLCFCPVFIARRSAHSCEAVPRAVLLRLLASSHPSPRQSPAALTTTPNHRNFRTSPFAPTLAWRAPTLLPPELLHFIHRAVIPAVFGVAPRLIPLSTTTAILKHHATSRKTTSELLVCDRIRRIYPYYPCCSKSRQPSKLSACCRTSE